MRFRRTACCGAVIVLAAGCTAGSNLPTADDLLAGAHDSLAQDDPATARTWLSSARPRLESDRQKKEYELMAAELELRSGNAEPAQAAIEGLLGRYPDDPRVHELAGKTDLRLGDFAGARRHFEVCAAAYGADEDVGRANDLVALAEGFESYARGHLGTARDRWARIREPRLRASVLDASAMAPDAASGGALVRSRKSAY